MPPLLATNLNHVFGRFPLLTLLALGLLSFSAHANNTQVVESIHAFLYAQTHELGDEVHIDVFPPAAQLPPCIQPHPFFPRSGQPKWGRVAVAVRCGEKGEQVRYLQANIKVFGDYLVPTETINAGTAIRAEMLGTQYGELSALPKQAILNPDEVIGQLARRSLQAGQVIQQHQLREQPLVERGQAVTIEATGQGFRIAREGTAMEAGALGASVRVKVAPREILTGIVVGKGRLMISHP